MRLKVLLAGLLAGTILAGQAAYAVESGGVSDVVTNTTVTGTSGNCLGANGYRRALTLDATASAANIGYCEVAPGSSSCTAVIGTVGTTTLTAGSLDYWPAGSSPQNGFCFIAATGSQPLTIKEGQ